MAASFAVYALPVATPHGPWLVGQMVWWNLGRLASGEQPLWAGVNVGFALLLQLAAWSICRWVMAAGRRRWLALLAAAPVGVWVANVAYLAVIPAWFLVEDDRAVEHGDWALACEIAGASLVEARAGVQLELAQAREAWIARDSERRYEVLSMPGCRSRPTGLERANSEGLDFVSPGGAVLYRTRNRATGAERHWVSIGNGSSAEPLDPPGEEHWRPVLSRQARAIAWLEPAPEAAVEGIAHRVVIRGLDGEPERHVLLAGDLWSGPHLLSLDTSAEEIVLATGSGAVAAVDLAGAVEWGPVDPGEIDNVRDNFRRHAGGWVAWDAYREEGRYRLLWSLPLGGGRHEIPKGRRITDIAVDPWGRYLAVSVSSAVRVGDIRDAVYVLRADDGSETYRRYLERFSRTPMAFLGPHFLAFTRYESRGDGVGARVEILRVPGRVAMERVDAWVSAYRARIGNVLPLFAKLDGEGLGEHDCGPLAAATASRFKRAPDELTADMAGALSEALAEAHRQCARWDPSPFELAMLDIERLVGAIEDHLVYEYGVEVFPETSLMRGGEGGARIGPLEMPDGGVRVKRYRTP